MTRLAELREPDPGRDVSPGFPAMAARAVPVTVSGAVRPAGLQPPNGTHSLDSTGPFMLQNPEPRRDPGAAGASGRALPALPIYGSSRAPY